MSSLCFGSMFVDWWMIERLLRRPKSVLFGRARGHCRRLSRLRDGSGLHRTTDRSVRHPRLDLLLWYRQRHSSGHLRHQDPSGSILHLDGPTLADRNRVGIRCTWQHRNDWPADGVSRWARRQCLLEHDRNLPDWELQQRQDLSRTGCPL